MQFLDQEGVRHMLEFWIAADSYQSHFKAKLQSGEHIADEALDDAMILYNKLVEFYLHLSFLPIGKHCF